MDLGLGRDYTVSMIIVESVNMVWLRTLPPNVPGEGLQKVMSFSPWSAGQMGFLRKNSSLSLTEWPWWLDNEEGDIELMKKMSTEDVARILHDMDSWMEERHQRTLALTRKRKARQRAGWTDEERLQWLDWNREKNARWRAGLTDEEREGYAEKRKALHAKTKLTEEETPLIKEERLLQQSEKAKARRAARTEEEKAQDNEKQRAIRAALTEEKLEERRAKARAHAADKRVAMTEEELLEHREKHAANLRASRKRKADKTAEEELAEQKAIKADYDRVYKAKKATRHRADIAKSDDGNEQQ